MNIVFMAKNIFNLLKNDVFLGILLGRSLPFYSKWLAKI
jgi:hypothetical protein